MNYFKAFAFCMAAFALQNTAWAEIYETTDAEGNPEFSDSPPDADAEVVDLPKTNLADAPPPQLPNEQQSDPVAVEQQRVNENNPVIINDANTEADDERLKRLKDTERRHSATPYEVGDTDSQMPHEVGDSDSQMPHEVGDSDSQMPHEVGDSTEETPEDYEESLDGQPTEGQRVHHRAPHRAHRR